MLQLPKLPMLTDDTVGDTTAATKEADAAVGVAASVPVAAIVIWKIPISKDPLDYTEKAFTSHCSTDTLVGLTRSTREAEDETMIAAGGDSSLIIAFSTW